MVRRTSRDAEGARGKDGEPSSQSTASAAYDVYATVHDHATFVARVMQHQGLPRELRAARGSIHAVESSGDACDAERVARCPDRVGFGLGWLVLEYPGETVLWHTGGDRGERALAFYSPARREGMVILTSGANGL